MIRDILQRISDLFDQFLGPKITIIIDGESIDPDNLTITIDGKVIDPNSIQVIHE